MAEKRNIAQISAALQEALCRVEVDAFGVARLEDWQGTRLEEAALKLLPRAHSVVVFAAEVYPEVLDLTSPGRTVGAASLNDLLDRHMEYLAGRLTKAAYDIARVSHMLGLKALPLPGQGLSRDTRFFEAVISYKHAAQAAGLGKLGWHSLLISPRFGPRVQLSGCLTEAELQPLEAAQLSLSCDTCRICLESCPAHALAEPENGEQYSINKFACNAFLNGGGGCSLCMQVCPVGR